MQKRRIQGLFFDAGGFGNFKGKIIRRKKGHWCLIERVFVQWEYVLDVLEDYENHVWIRLDKTEDKNLKVGDCISFSGEVKPYRRRNGSYELGVDNIHFVEKIENYDLPSEKKLKKQFWNQINCEVCLFSEHCFGFCLFQVD